jgi:hypothetical protein
MEEIIHKIDEITKFDRMNEFHMREREVRSHKKTVR